MNISSHTEHALPVWSVGKYKHILISYNSSTAAAAGAGCNIWCHKGIIPAGLVCKHMHAHARGKNSILYKSGVQTSYRIIRWVRNLVIRYKKSSSCGHLWVHPTACTHFYPHVFFPPQWRVQGNKKKRAPTASNLTVTKCWADGRFENITYITIPP